MSNSDWQLPAREMFSGYVSGSTDGLLFRRHFRRTHLVCEKLKLFSADWLAEISLWATYHVTPAQKASVNFAPISAAAAVDVDMYVAMWMRLPSSSEPHGCEYPYECEYLLLLLVSRSVLSHPHTRTNILLSCSSWNKCFAFSDLFSVFWFCFLSSSRRIGELGNRGIGESEEARRGWLKEFSF
uniref:HDC14891 n=1 Tax=Drosophila melanogaster TaxID=7227 RepID=Q6IJH6_DROME|nr:TPA_inf: HDC14891 [Drosophila melanogaster]